MSDLTAHEKNAHKRDVRPRRVLVVDDDVDLAESLEDILAAHGFEVMLAHDARSAQAAIEAYEADVALLDIRLGRDRGIDLVAPFQRRRPKIVCILMTAHAEIDTAVQAVRPGVYDYLSKPVHPTEMLATLARAFEKIDLERTAESARLHLISLAVATSERIEQKNVVPMFGEGLRLRRDHHSASVHLLPERRKVDNRAPRWSRTVSLVKDSEQPSLRARNIKWFDHGCRITQSSSLTKTAWTSNSYSW